jgi:hypothetical protein
MVGQDGAFSIPLRGQTLWFFGDTLIGRREPGASLWFIDGKPIGPHDMSGRGGIDRMINNTALLVPAGEGPDVLQEFRYICNGDGRMKALLPLEGDEHPDRERIWCQHGLAVDDEVYLSFIKVRMKDEPSPPLPIGFDIIGSGLAIGSTSDWNFRRIERGGSSILWTERHPHFAGAILCDAVDGYCYLYGTVQVDGVYQCFVARARPVDLARVESYEYFSGDAPRWSRDVNEAAPVFDRMPSELSVSFNPYLGRYLGVHSLDLTGIIVGRTAPSPWGPWSDPVELWKVQPSIAPSESYPALIYAGKEHAEIAAEGGRKIYLTYIEFEEYFPHLVEVTLA